jgi:KUP system potassium uptake protein
MSEVAPSGSTSESEASTEASSNDTSSSPLASSDPPAGSLVPVVPAPTGTQRTRPPAHTPHTAHSGPMAALALAALGVVYGDIGTSPLYALKECLQGPHGVAAVQANVFGVLSLMFWSLTMVITLKYVTFIMRADNEGEGGTLALLALVKDAVHRKDGSTSPLVLLVLFGAALLYGDGVITPAISVLSAVEGLNVATPALKSFVVPLTVGILLGLFIMQKHGTEGIGRVFGPVMVVWFGTLSVLGAIAIAKNPGVFAALNPVHGIRFLATSGHKGFLVLGSVVLCVTGGEALYADMGHFGAKPIRVAWLGVVMPALVINYFGQGANVLMTAPEVVASPSFSPFYALVPRFLLYPMVLLAAAAAVIASQAMISGAFSLTRQAVQLGYCPRVTIVHTSKEHEGQIYIPEINWALLIACLALVIRFESSDKLASAYGIAVTGTMTITSIVFFTLITKVWNWPLWRAIPLVGLFLIFDLGFLAANVIKIADGGWVPLAMASGIFALMTTWKTGRLRLGLQIMANAIPLDDFLSRVRKENTPRVDGTAVFMSANPKGIPPVLAHHYAHNQVLHDQVVLLSILSEAVPFVSARNRILVRNLGQGFFQVSARFGFMESPNVPALLEACAIFDLPIDPETVTFYLGRETLLSSEKAGMMRWRKALFAFISRNARPATLYFGIPPNRVVELGMQVEL